jgi:hypothetical protein
MRVDDVAAVTDLMESTLVLGRPLGGADLRDYVRACLEPYVGRRARDAAVIVDDHRRVLGYALVCVDPARGEVDTRRAMLRLGARVLWTALRGQLNPVTRRFYLARIRDIAGLMSVGSARTTRPHAHLNIDIAVRSGTAALLLLDHIDARVAAAGFGEWIGEVNAPEGRRAGALERLGFVVIERRRNVTLSWCAGRPVERLTLLRTLTGPMPAQAGSALTDRAQA